MCIRDRNNPPLAGYLSVGVEQQPATCPSAPSSCTYSFSGSPCTGTITLNPGETLCVNSGIFDCDLNMQGGTVYVAAGATFDPNILLENEGTIINCGTVNFRDPIFQPNTEVHNYGDMTFRTGTLVNRTDIFNYAGGIMTINGNILVSDFSSITNSGELTVTNNMTVSRGTFYNDYLSFIGGTLIVETNGATFENYGRVTSNGEMRINTGSTFVNECSMVSNGTITLDAVFTTGGLYYANTAGGRIQINSQARVTNNGTFVTQNMEINGVVLGNGEFWVENNSSNNGSVGSDGNGLNFYDLTNNGVDIFDTQNRDPHPSVTNFPPNGPLPTQNTILPGCSEFITDIACDANNNSSITPIISGLSEPANYQWNTGSTAQSLGPIGDGEYSLTITDANGCVFIESVTIASQEKCDALFDENCFNGLDDDSDGLIDCSDCSDCSDHAACPDQDGDGVSNSCDIDACLLYTSPSPRDRG